MYIFSYKYGLDKGLIVRYSEQMDNITNLHKSDKDEKVICIDVDDTLVMRDVKLLDKTVSIVDPYSGLSITVTPHIKHIDLVEHFHDRGYYVIVWSAGGGLWAQAVVEALHLNKYVDDIMGKPLKYMDDVPCDEWMGNRIYLEP